MKISLTPRKKRPEDKERTYNIFFNDVFAGTVKHHQLNDVIDTLVENREKQKRETIFSKSWIVDLADQIRDLNERLVAIEKAFLEHRILC